LTLRRRSKSTYLARGFWLSTLGIVVLGVALATTAANAQDDINPEQYYRLATEAETERDYVSMVRWLNQSAQGGYRPAQEWLGIVYLTGQSLYGDAVPINHCEALGWFHRAAAQGSPAGRTLSLLLLRLDRGAVVKFCSLN
jgi:TPR repeat protein